MKKKPRFAMEFAESAKSRAISIVEHTEKAIEEAEKNNKRFAHFCLIAKKDALVQARWLEKLAKQGKAKGRLFGLPVSVKDCICAKGIESRAGSKILSGYKPLFDSTAVARMRGEGAIILGKTSQDEFGFGTFSANVGVGFKVPKNPFDAERSCGGSSGGSAGQTALTKFSHVSLSESTGGSIACPASFCGVAGLTPTYGRVSRYGLIDYANSLDKIGTMGKTVEDAALLLEVIAGHDEKESTSLPNPAEKYSSFAGKGVKGMRFGIVKELFGEGIDKKVSDACWSAIKSLESQGATIEELSLPLNAKYSIPAYYLIATAESSTNLAKFCGMRYGLHLPLKGNFDEYFSEVRSTAFGEEAKRRIILGTFARMSGFRDAFYVRAMKVRTKLINEFKSSFKKFDALLNPTMPIIAPRFSEIAKLSPLQNYSLDLCTTPANLAGLPHLSVNAGFGKGMPVGLMVTTDFLQESKLVQIGSALEAE